MLQMASSPITSSSCRADPQPRTATRTQEKKLGFLQTDFGFQPRVNSAIPDYEGLYKAFQRRAAKRRVTREVTRNKPFLLRTASLCHTQRPCDADATGGRKVRTHAVAGGSKTEARNPRRAMSQWKAFLCLNFLKNTGSAVSISIRRSTIPINLRPQEYFFSFPFSRVQVGLKGRELGSTVVSLYQFQRTLLI